jgi:hypothetical protein
MMILAYVLTMMNDPMLSTEEAIVPIEEFKNYRRKKHRKNKKGSSDKCLQVQQIKKKENIGTNLADLDIEIERLFKSPQLKSLRSRQKNNVNVNRLKDKLKKFDEVNQYDPEIPPQEEEEQSQSPISNDSIEGFINFGDIYSKY